MKYYVVVRPMSDPSYRTTFSSKSYQACLDFLQAGLLQGQLLGIKEDLVPSLTKFFLFLDRDLIVASEVFISESQDTTRPCPQWKFPEGIKANVFDTLKKLHTINPNLTYREIKDWDLALNIMSLVSRGRPNYL